MPRHVLMLSVTVKDGERAFVTRNGRLERVLEPGRHRLFDPRNELTVEALNVVRAEFPAERYAVLKAARPDLTDQLFEAVETIRRRKAAPGPLLQAWFSAAYPNRSPYRLYALSNLGSLIALLSYPFVFEPAFDVLT